MARLKTGLSNEVAWFEPAARSIRITGFDYEGPAQNAIYGFVMRSPFEQKLLSCKSPNRSGVEEPDSLLVVEIREKIWRGSTCGFAILKHGPTPSY